MNSHWVTNIRAKTKTSGRKLRKNDLELGKALQQMDDQLKRK